MFCHLNQGPFSLDLCQTALGWKKAVNETA